MFKAILAFTMIFSGLAGAQPNFSENREFVPLEQAEEFPERIACVSAPYLTTSFFIHKYANKVQLRVWHHNGLKYLPIHNSLIAKSDIPKLKQKAELFSQLGKEIVVSWDLKDCEWQGQGDLSCHRIKDEQVGDLKVRSVGLTLLPQELRNKYGAFRSIQAQFDFGVRNDNIVRLYHMPMQYTSSKIREANECWASVDTSR